MQDIDRLNETFTTLAKQGIVGHHNFWCCGGCAAGGAENAYNALPDAEKAEVTGAVYYHEQDADRVINDSRWGLTLHYRAFPHNNDDARKAVGHQIERALFNSGLTVEWSGDPSDFIEVVPFRVTLNEVPMGVGNFLHERYDEDDR